MFLDGGLAILWGEQWRKDLKEPGLSLGPRSKHGEGGGAKPVSLPHPSCFANANKTINKSPQQTTRSGAQAGTACLQLPAEGCYQIRSRLLR